MFQVSGEFNCSDTLKAKYHHLRSDAENAKLWVRRFDPCHVREIGKSVGSWRNTRWGHSQQISYAMHDCLIKKCIPYLTLPYLATALTLTKKIFHCYAGSKNIRVNKIQLARNGILDTIFFLFFNIKWEWNYNCIRYFLLLFYISLFESLQFCQIFTKCRQKMLTLA